MATVFCERKRVLMVNIYATSDHNNVTNVLRNTKKTCVGPDIQNKRRGMLTFGVVLFHENARPHMSTAARTRALLGHFNWELFDHLPYSPNLALSDYHLFTYLKNCFGSQRSNNNE
jgi:hypothetical protein